MLVPLTRYFTGTSTFSTNTGVVGREEQIAMRLAWSKRVHYYPHRPDLSRIGMARAIDPPVTDPHDRHGSPINQPDVVAEFQSSTATSPRSVAIARAGDEAG